MSRQEDFDTQSDKYVEMRKSFGVNDPYAIKEIGEAHYQGAEYGYQYAVDKACEWLQENLYVLRTFKDPRVNKYEIFIRMLRGAMEE